MWLPLSLLLLLMFLLILRCRVRTSHALPEVAILLPLMNVRCRVQTRRAEVGAVPASIFSVSAAASALPDAYKSRAVRGRNFSTFVPAAECALPGATKPRRGRIAEVPIADCALPGVRVSSSTRGRQTIPVVPDVPDISDEPDTDISDDPDADDVLQVPVAALSGECTLGATRRKVFVDPDDTCAQLSANDISPLTDRKHRCANCASMGLCKKHCITERSSRFSKVATTKILRGFPGNQRMLKRNPPIRFHPLNSVACVARWVNSR